MEDQDELIFIWVIRKSDREEVGLEDDMVRQQAVLDDVHTGIPYNANLYIANQEVVYN